MESFQLDAAIAGACAGKSMLNLGIEQCRPVDSNDIYFGPACASNGINVVGTDPDGDEACYHAFYYAEMYLSS